MTNKTDWYTFVTSLTVQKHFYSVEIQCFATLPSSVSCPMLVFSVSFPETENTFVTFLLLLFVCFFAVLFDYIVLNLFTVQHFSPVLSILKCFINKLDWIVSIFPVGFCFVVLFFSPQQNKAFVKTFEFILMCTQYCIWSSPCLPQHYMAVQITSLVSCRVITVN